MAFFWGFSALYAYWYIKESTRLSLGTLGNLLIDSKTEFSDYGWGPTTCNEWLIEGSVVFDEAILGIMWDD